MNDVTAIERVRCTIAHAHVFQLPPRQAASVGWRGADWKEKVWQGNVKVVDRNDLTAVLLVQKQKGSDITNNGNNINGTNGRDSIFAVCPIKDGAVERCVDSSRYFVLRIENQNGRHTFIGVAFNERNDAFDFNTALEDARREREFELKNQFGTGTGGTGTGSMNDGSQSHNMDGSFNDGNSHNNGMNFDSGPAIDYSLKEGEKIRVAIPNGKKNLSSMDNILFQGGGGTAAFANFQLDSPESVDTSNTNDRIVAAKARKVKKVVEPPSRSSFFSAFSGSTSKSTTGGFALKPSSKDTPTRTTLK